MILALRVLKETNMCALFLIAFCLLNMKPFSLQVYYWKAPSGQTPHEAAHKATIDASTTLSLKAYTSYRFQVVAYNSIGDGPASNVVGPLTTPEASKIN